MKQRIRMSDDTQAMIELPKYVSHKQVWALKLARIEMLPENAGVRLFFHDERYAPLERDYGYQLRIKDGGDDPDDPGYFVRYPDGYESWSPTKAFEEGYTPVVGP